MTDQRVSDLPYGQVGDCTYDVEQQTWTFASRFSYNYGIQPVDSPRRCLPPSLPHNTSTVAPSLRVQNTVLTKRFPELIPASFITSELEKAAPDHADTLKETLSTSSSLVAIGKATERMGNKGGALIDVIAIASGKAGEVLRIIRPHISKLSWPEDGAVHIEIMDPEKALEECYWAGNGGPIRQIIFAAEEDGRSIWLASPSTWLAVRQFNCTTVFRPIYQREPIPAILPNGSALKYPPSRLNPNPLVTLPIAETGGLCHADVAFNPFYARQIGVIDEGGSWSIWDIEGYVKTTFKLERSKNGHIFDDFESENNRDIADGWGRILWAGDVNTLVVCGRCHFAALNIKAEPTRLQTPDVFSSMSSGWILDVKQNVRQLNQLFVLTSARLFWLEILPEDGEVIVLFSCRHFRDEDGENMKLEILSEESSCTVFLYSATNILINTYRFSTAHNQNGMPETMDSSFVCRDISENLPQKKMHSLAMIASRYGGQAAENGDTGTGPGSKYLENDILFYQLFTLNTNLELQVTLCSTTFPLTGNSTSGSKFELITPPSFKQAKTITRQPRFEMLADPFIVPDGLEDDSDQESSKQAVPFRSRGRYRHKGRSQLQPYAMDYNRVFKNVFPDEVQADGEVEGQSEDALEFIKSLPQRIGEWKEDEKASLTTLIELTESLTFSGDIDDAAVVFSDVLSSLPGEQPEEEETESKKVLTVSPINGRDPNSLTATMQGAVGLPDLISCYNSLLDTWVASLPRQTPGTIRYAKEILIRKIATELALSSAAISMRIPQEKKPDQILEPDAMTLDRSTPFSSQPEPPESSQRRARSMSMSIDPGLPTPAYTPSLVSDGPNEGGEDPAISLLRTYVDFQPQKPNGTTVSRIQSHWTPGSDPDHYSYEAMRRAQIIAGGGDEDSRRKEERKKKKAEKKMMRYQRSGTSESASQPPTISFSQPPTISFSQPTAGITHSSPLRPMGGSQPTLAPNITSSQPGRDIPMTQVEEGQFGGRQVFKKKKAKKRKQGF